MGSQLGERTYRGDGGGQLSTKKYIRRSVRHTFSQSFFGFQKKGLFSHTKLLIKINLLYLYIDYDALITPKEFVDAIRHSSGASDSERFCVP